MAAPLGFALIFPSLFTWFYFVQLNEADVLVRQTVYAAGKLIQFGFPLFWIVRVLRRKIAIRGPSGKGLIAGLLFGVGTSVALFLLYQGTELGDVGERLRDKLAGFGVDSAGEYWALALFYSVTHSFLEEYYWRWFVYAGLRERSSVLSAVSLSSVGFMAHHVIVLAAYFGWSSPATYLLAAAVGLGGAAWALLYERSGSLYGPWLSHLLVDAGVFLVGYSLVFSSS